MAVKQRRELDINRPIRVVPTRREYRGSMRSPDVICGRRESNAGPARLNDMDSQELTSSIATSEGNWEDAEFTDCHRMAGIDPGLWNIIKIWNTLPAALRVEVDAKCLEP